VIKQFDFALQCQNNYQETASVGIWNCVVNPNTLMKKQFLTTDSDLSNGFVMYEADETNRVFMLRGNSFQIGVSW